MTDAEIKSLFGVLKAAEDLVAAYEDEFREVEHTATGCDDLTAWTSAFQFRWLHTKLKMCRPENAALEAAFLKVRPETMFFMPSDFERLIQAILGLVGGRRYQLTSTSHDEGVDLLERHKITEDWSYEAWAMTIVQCKLYRGFVPVTDLRDFFGAMVAKTATGLFFTTGSLTAQGKRFLPQANASSMANRFHLIAPPSLDRLLTICERLAEITIGDDSLSEAEFRAEASSLRRSAHAVIYAKWMPPLPAQGSLW